MPPRLVSRRGLEGENPPRPVTNTTHNVPILLCKAGVNQGFMYEHCLGSRSVMAPLDAGCARITRPHWYAHALVNDAQAMKIVFTPLSVSFCFLPVLSLSSSFLSSHHFPLKSFLPSTQYNNYDLRLRTVQTLYLHLGHSTPLRKTLTVNHYLRIEYFQQALNFIGE